MEEAKILKDHADRLRQEIADGEVSGNHSEDERESRRESSGIDMRKVGSSKPHGHP